MRRKCKIMRGLQFVFCSNLRWHPENRNIFLATRIFAFLGQVKSGVDVGRDYGVTQWGDIMILACNSNRSQSLEKREKKVSEDGIFLQTGAGPGHCADKSCHARHRGAGSEGLSVLFISKRISAVYALMCTIKFQNRRQLSSQRR